MKKLLFLGFTPVQIELARKFVTYRGLSAELEVLSEQHRLSASVDAYVINGDDPSAVSRLALHHRTNPRPVIGLGSRPAPGVTHYTAGAFKPATADWLVDILSKEDVAGGPNAAAANVMTFPAAPAAMPSDVLVVDDSEIVRRTMVHKIKEYGHRVDVASDGNDALAMLLNNRYRLIFLDVMMPGLDGFEVCKRIKRSVEYKSTAVYMLSSKDGMFDKVRGSMAGCNGYLTKPLESSRLREVLDLHLERKAARAESTLFVAPPLPVPERAAVSPARAAQAPEPQPDFRPTFAPTEPGYMSDFQSSKK